MKLKVAAVVVGALVLAATAYAGEREASVYVRAHRADNGGYHEPRSSPTPGLTAWAILGLSANRHCTAQSGKYLRGKPYPAATDLELRILALDAMRDLPNRVCRFDADLSGQVRQLQRLRRSTGQIGPSVNSTIWGVLALRAVERRVGRKTKRWLLARQRPSGGWPWAAGGSADSNDTAAAIQALVAVGAREHSRRINRGVRFLRRLQNGDGGFELRPGRGSDIQSTAWAIQALIAADRKPGRRAFGYLRRMQRPNGSYRYNRQYVTTPVWVTSQALVALARKPFPLQ